VGQVPCFFLDSPQLNPQGFLSNTSSMDGLTGCLLFSRRFYRLPYGAHVRDPARPSPPCPTPTLFGFLLFQFPPQDRPQTPPPPPNRVHFTSALHAAEMVDISPRVGPFGWVTVLFRLEVQEFSHPTRYFSAPPPLLEVLPPFIVASVVHADKSFAGECRACEIGGFPFAFLLGFLPGSRCFLRRDYIRTTALLLFLGRGYPTLLPSLPLVALRMESHPF